MELSFALTRHRLIAERAAGKGYGRQTGVEDGSTPRPEGQLVWINLDRDITTDGTVVILEALLKARPHLHVVLSGAHDLLTPSLQVIRRAAPFDTPAVAEAGFAQWRPDLFITSGPNAYPFLWRAAHERGIPCFALNAAPSRHPYPLVRDLDTCALLHTVLSEPNAVAREAHLTGPLCAVAPPPSVFEADCEALSKTLATRPVWLAAGTPQAEIKSVVAAHRRAARLSHRLLLLLSPSNSADGPALAMELEAQGWRVALRSDGAEPGKNTQIYVVDDEDELGLWVRLATITYLGGTLSSEPVTCPVGIPAGLGSVVVHGPYMEDPNGLLARLHAAGAAVKVPSSDSLGDEVERLQAPDLVASKAHLAWQIVSEGAETSNLVLSRIEACLDGLLGT